MALERIYINGGKKLEGKITISGAKNAALPLLVTSLLTDREMVFSNVPNLLDITSMISLLKQHGAVIKNNDGICSIHFGEVTSHIAPYDLVRKMRASILVLGPLLARCRKAKVSLPGGCSIGTRPVDLHIQGLISMGANIDLHDGYIVADAPNGLKAAVICFPFVSVGATENLMMAATLADGETILENAACEPEVVDLARCLMAMGADIEGIGTKRLIIKGVKNLDSANYSIMPDRIETATYAIAAAMTYGTIELVNAFDVNCDSSFATLEKAGIRFYKSPKDNSVIVKVQGECLKGVDVMTEPFPGFPTDLQAQHMAMMSVSSGASMVTETVFENRFMHVPELKRMGADINVHGSSALVRGVAKLRGAPVMATDLRASVSLVLAALAAEGETLISRVYHLDRGYENLEKKLQAVGADIKRLS